MIRYYLIFYHEVWNYLYKRTFLGCPWPVCNDSSLRDTNPAVASYPTNCLLHFTITPQYCASSFLGAAFSSHPLRPPLVLASSETSTRADALSSPPLTRLPPPAPRFKSSCSERPRQDQCASHSPTFTSPSGPYLPHLSCMILFSNYHIVGYLSRAL
jgi:hypothetical protein